MDRYLSWQLVVTEVPQGLIWLMQSFIILINNFADGMQYHIFIDNCSYVDATVWSRKILTLYVV